MHARPRVRIAAVGCGSVFERCHLPALRASDDWELVALCEADADRLAWAAAAAPEATPLAAVTDLEGRDDVDAVLVATPPVTHAPIALEALAQGRHVLVEKPMATDLADAEAMVRASRSASQRIAVGFNRRFRPTYASARAQLRDRAPDDRGYVGHTFIADTGRWIGGGAASSRAARLEALLHDVASHQVDLVPWLVGRPVVAARSDDEIVEPARAIVQLELRLEGGLVCRCCAGHDRRYEERFEASLGRGAVTVFPGCVVTSAGSPGRLTRLRGRARSLGELVAARVARRPSLTIESFRRQLAAFAALVRGAEPEGEQCADAMAGLRAVAGVDACRRSLDDRGAWHDVRWDEELEG